MGRYRAYTILIQDFRTRNICARERERGRKREGDRENVLIKNNVTKS